jgi:integral membrane protein
MQTLKALRIIAVVEALSWLALIVATIVKYSADAPLGVKILGPTHGVLFLAYVGLTFEVRRRTKWDNRTTLIVLADSILPGGGFIVARRADLREPIAAA